jgi:putative two-component system response regulator
MPKCADKQTIMVVDDTAENLKLLESMLEGEGYDVRVFPSGAMMLKAAEKAVPDLVMLDILMPDMDGYEVCRRMRSSEVLRDVPVLFLSALTDVKNKVKAFDVGGMDYVTKPFQFEEVKARVKTHLLLRGALQELEGHRSGLEKIVAEKVREISESQLATITALSKLAESRDDETGYHIERTRTFCKILCEYLRRTPRYENSIDEEYVSDVYNASVLHDVGKVGIPDRILLKPDRLTPPEFDMVKTHTAIGARTLQAAHRRYPRNSFINMGIAIARSHHERWNGNGYPDGLKGEDIPLSARIMAVADVYDALRTKRPYKPAMPHEEVARMLRDGSGKDFDPAVVEAFNATEKDFVETYDVYARKRRPGSTTRSEGFF